MPVVTSTDRVAAIHSSALMMRSPMRRLGASRLRVGSPLLEAPSSTVCVDMWRPFLFRRCYWPAREATLASCSVTWDSVRPT